MRTSRTPARSNTPSTVLILILAATSIAAEEQATSTISYDAFGFRAEYVSPLGGIQTYDHGHLGVETGVRLNGASIVEDADFGPHGQLERITYGALDGRPRRVARRAFDGLSRPTALSLETEGTTGYDYRADSFRFNERGFVTGFDRADQAVGTVDVRYRYSAQGELDTFSWGTRSLTYAYDPRGNLVERGGGLGVPSRGTAGNVAYDRHNRNSAWRYDGAGRVVADDRYRYQYDSKGRVRMLRDKTSGAWIAHYLYDDQGHRVRVLEPDRVTYVHRDDTGAVAAELVRDRRLDIEETREHVSLNGVSVLEVTHAAGGKIGKAMRFADSLGNPAVTWTADTETVHEYSPFGGAMDVGASTPHQGAHGFTGHEDDPTGLTYMRARYYDADAARFNQPDPGRDFDPATPASWNLYQYARNNPASFVDPSGEAIIVGHLAPEHQKQLLDGLSAFTGNTYDVKDNKLVFVDGNFSSSGVATRFLNRMIDPENEYGRTYHVRNGLTNEAELGGEVLTLDFEGLADAIASGIDPRTFNVGALLIHELLHLDGLPDPTKADAQSEDPARNQGPVVEFVNRIRTERGLATRDRYAATPVPNSNLVRLTFTRRDKEGNIIATGTITLRLIEVPKE